MPTPHLLEFVFCIMFVLTADLLSAQTKVEFRKGYYIGQDGNRVDGFLAYKPNKGRIVHYLRNENAQPEKIKAKHLTGFVIDKDSFAIISDFFVEGVYTDLIRVRKPDIAKVTEIGPVILYQCHYFEVLSTSAYVSPTGGTQTMRDERQQETMIPVYILRRKDSPLLQSVPESQASFNKVMSKYFEDDPNLAEEIANGKYANRTTPELVRRFNNNTQ